MYTRNIDNQCINVNNDIATAVLVWNNTVSCGDKVYICSMTIYQLIGNQSKEVSTYHIIYELLSTRILR